MLTLEEKAACLKRGIFSSLEDDTLLSIAQRMGERDMADGETLFLLGEAGDEIFIVVDGEIEITIGEHTVAVLGAGELFGEMAVLGGGRRTAGGRTKGETKLLFLKDKAIRLLIQQIPDIAFAIFRILITRLEEANRINRFLSGDVRKLGELVVVSGSLSGKTFDICHSAAVIGKSSGGASDVLKVALPETSGLLENHAWLEVKYGTAFIEPRDGEVSIGGELVEDGMALQPEDVVSLGGLEIRVSLAEGGND